MTDPTKRYVARCLAPGNSLADVMADVTLPDAFQAAFGHRLLARPLFASEGELKALGADVHVLFEVLVSLPDRLFDGDLDRYARHLGLPRARRDVFRDLTVPPPQYGRVDAYHDGESLRLLELNLGSRAGGVEMPLLCSALLAHEEFRLFADENGLSWTDTARQYARALFTAVLGKTGSREPVAAIVDVAGILRELMPVMRSVAEMLANVGIVVVFADLHEVRRHRGRVTVNGQPVDIVLRYFTDDELIDDPEAAAVYRSLHRADEEGEVVLWTPLQSELHANKGALALISDPQYSGALTKAEAEVADRLLPWTRVLRDGAALVDGEKVDLLDYCRARRTELVLKPQNDFGGRSVLAGWECDETQWDSALRERDGGPHIVQRRVVPAQEPVVDPASGAVGRWEANWGVFLTPEGYGGAFGRALPAGAGAVIGTGASTGTRLAPVFTYPDCGRT